MVLSTLHYSLLAVVAILTFATVVASILGQMNPENKTLKNVMIIVRSWWLIVIVIGTAMALGKYALLALFFSISLLVLNEYLKRSLYGNGRRRLLFFILASTLVLQYVALVEKWDELFLFLIPIAALSVIPLVIILTHSISNLPLAFGVVVGLMLLNYYLSHIPALVFTQKILWDYDGQSMLAVLILIFFTECNDVFQFLSGKLFGRRKIVPHVSPNKTEMGFIGGILCTTIATAFGAPLILDITKMQGASLGLAIAIFGILGDLFFSAVKRHLQIKDFSQALPGHGGFIDRIDSLIFTAPIYFHLLTYIKRIP